MQAIYKAVMLAWVLALGLTGCGGGTPNSTVELSTGTVQGTSTKADPIPVVRINLKEGQAAQRPLTNGTFDRSQTYQLYASNGSVKTLRLSFASGQYEILDGQQSTSGTFSEAVDEPGTFVFGTSRVTPTLNTARFRLVAGAAIGAFPFEVVDAPGGRYEVVPFVAANDFVTEAAELDGEFNRLSVSRSSAGARGTQVQAFRISDAGTALEMCWHNIVYRIDRCPEASVRRYAIVADGLDG